MVQLADSYDPRLVERYADDAKIHIGTRLNDGSVSRSEIAGPQVKELLRKIRPLAVKRRSRSTYENITISVEGKYARIAATRHDVTSCHRDPYWFAVVEVQGDRTYRIGEENMEIGGSDGCVRT